MNDKDVKVGGAMEHRWLSTNISTEKQRPCSAAINGDNNADTLESEPMSGTSVCFSHQHDRALIFNARLFAIIFAAHDCSHDGRDTALHYVMTLRFVII